MSDRAEKAIEDIALSHESLRAERDQLRARVERLEKVAEAARMVCIAKYSIGVPVTERLDQAQSVFNSIVRIFDGLETALDALRDGEEKVYLARNGPDTTNEGLGVPPKKWKDKAK